MWVLDLGHPAGLQATTVPQRFVVPRSERLRSGYVFRGELRGNIGFSGNVALAWFAVEDERREVRANDFISAGLVISNDGY